MFLRGKTGGGGNMLYIFVFKWVRIFLFLGISFFRYGNRVFRVLTYPVRVP